MNHKSGKNQPRRGRLPAGPQSAAQPDTRRSQSAAVFLAAVLLLAGAAVCAAEAAVPPLDRLLQLDLWGAGLNDAAREIKAQTGAELLFYRHDLPADRNTDNVYLVTGRVSLRAVMECLARRFAFRYRVSEAGRLELSKGYGWAGGEPALRIFRADHLVPPGGGPEAVQKILAELVPVLPLLPGDCSVSAEPYPTPENPAAVRCTAVLPPVLAEYLERAVECLAGDVSPPARGERQFTAAADTGTAWEALLTRPAVSPTGSSLRAVLKAAAVQTNTAIAVFPPVSSDTAPLLDLNAPAVGLGRAAEELSSRYFLGRRVFLAAGGIVFEGGAPEAEMDSRSRELFWSGLDTAGFSAREAAERAGGEAALLAVLKREIFPAVWRDPVCTMAYSTATGRLAVIAPPNVTEAVGRRIAGLADR